MSGRPPRIRSFDYTGFQRYFVTVCCAAREPFFEDRAGVAIVLAQLRHCCERDGFAILAYCFMPDHLHLLLEGECETCDLRRTMHTFKQQTGHLYGRRRAARLWQDGYFDHVLRDEDRAIAKVRYICENPVRAGLTRRFEEYPFCGSDRFSHAEIAEALQDATRR